MRKWLTLLLITTLVLTACGKSNEKASLEKSIDQLKKENKDLKKQKKKLQEQKDKLKHKQDSLQEDVNELPAKSTFRDKKNKDNHDAKEKSSDNQSTSANHDDQTNKIKSNQDEHDSQSSKPHTQQKPSQNDRKNNHRQER
ncbi:hypothetical protein K4Q81_07180 [Staphylococcus epidermidis]|nr:hypothetical protein [Staphylococcus epidermidis]MCG2186158.1 hypothetical protein [Staphylococcus epidermidis]